LTEKFRACNTKLSVMLLDGREPLRHLRLEGTRNLRDIGGYLTVEGRRTRWRTVFRSDCLNRLAPTAQTWLLEGGLRTVIDLRDDTEVAEAANVFAASPRVSYRRVPLFVSPQSDGAEPPTLGQVYRRILDERQCRVRAAFAELLAPGRLPALIHCVGGKDRTGLLVALLLSVAKVPRETIVEDYALSATCLGEKFVEEGRRWAAKRGWAWERYGHLWDCTPELMVEALDYLDHRYGGAEQYLTGIGLSAEQLERLREAITEPTG
jgi:protein-tyrosine phosphatase